jgi:hypothetical protein
VSDERNAGDADGGCALNIHTVYGKGVLGVACPKTFWEIGHSIRCGIGWSSVPNHEGHVVNT